MIPGGVVDTEKWYFTAVHPGASVESDTGATVSVGAADTVFANHALPSGGAVADGAGGASLTTRNNPKSNCL